MSTKFVPTKVLELGGKQFQDVYHDLAFSTNETVAKFSIGA